MTQLDLTDHNLYELDEMVMSNLKILHVGHNHIKSIPLLPPTLVELYCHENKLIELPQLPDSLLFLVCYGNKITKIQLPNNLKHLRCDFTCKLNNIPWSLETFDGWKPYATKLKLEYHNIQRKELGLLSVHKLPTKEEWDEIKTMYDYRIGGDKYLSFWKSHYP